METLSKELIKQQQDFQSKYSRYLKDTVGGEFGFDNWVHNYYRYKDKMVSVYSDDAFSDNFSVAVFTINDLRKRYNWYKSKDLELDNVSLNDVIKIMDNVLKGTK